MPRRRLAVRFLTHLQKGYNMLEQGRQADVLELWKNFSSMWNQAPVSILEGNQCRNGITCGLSNDGALLVRTEAGPRTPRWRFGSTVATCRSST